jgi:CDP-diacylglycerol pyrophosphatase
MGAGNTGTEICGVTSRIPSPALRFAGVVLWLVAGSVMARAADPDALWKIVHGRCVLDQQLNNDPAPCAAVLLAGGEARGHAILKDYKGTAQFLLIPTARLKGIEAPELLADGAPNYFAAAWAARAEMETVLHRPVPREDVGLAINSPHARSQEQLHIHIDCLRADVVAALHAAGAAIGPAWAPLPAPLAGHIYRARYLSEAAFLAANPFSMLAADVGTDAMAQQTLVVAGAASVDGQPGFVLLADHFDPATGDRASGEELQDHECGVMRGGTPKVPATR